MITLASKPSFKYTLQDVMHPETLGNGVGQFRIHLHYRRQVFT